MSNFHHIHKTQWFPLRMLSFGQKSCFFKTHHLWIPQPKWHLIYTILADVKHHTVCWVRKGEKIIRIVFLCFLVVLQLVFVTSFLKPMHQEQWKSSVPNWMGHSHWTKLKFHNIVNSLASFSGFCLGNSQTILCEGEIK